jgi:RsiW-degrading membrane proteinase PrsW (M82 family)
MMPARTVSPVSASCSGRGAPMKQNMLYLIIGALFVVVIALGAYVYREQTKPKGVELKIDDKGISIQQN